MAKQRLKLSGKALRFFKKVGSKGGKSRAKNYSRRKLKEWASLGGRPSRPSEQKATLLQEKYETITLIIERKFEASLAMAQRKFDAKNSRRLQRLAALKATFEKKKVQFEAGQVARQNRLKELQENEQAFGIKHAARQDTFDIMHAARQKRFDAKYAARQKKIQNAASKFIEMILGRKKKFELLQTTRRKRFEKRYTALSVKISTAA